MTIIASCGHTLTDIEGQGVLCSRRDYSREGNRASSYGSYCFACYKELVIEDEVLLTKEAEDEWLYGDDFEVESLDPDERSWYYDGDGTKRKKNES